MPRWSRIFRAFRGCQVSGCDGGTEDEGVDTRDGRVCTKHFRAALQLSLILPPEYQRGHESFGAMTHELGWNAAMVSLYVDAVGATNVLYDRLSAQKEPHWADLDYAQELCRLLGELGSDAPRVRELLEELDAR